MDNYLKVMRSQPEKHLKYQPTNIEKYTKGTSYNDFFKDTRTVYAVNANLRNVGEAVRVLSLFVLSKVKKQKR